MVVKVGVDLKLTKVDVEESTYCYTYLDDKVMVGMGTIYDLQDISSKKRFEAGLLKGLNIILENPPESGISGLYFIYELL